MVLLDLGAFPEEVIGGMSKDVVAWYFRPLAPPLSACRVLLWWEMRRLPYNAVVGVWGLGCLVVFFWAINSSGELKPGEDAVEPMALLAAPFFINLCYTLGWIVELIARDVRPSLPPQLGPRLLRLGLGFSLVVSSVPAVYWVGYRVMQWLEVL